LKRSRGAGGKWNGAPPRRGGKAWAPPFLVLGGGRGETIWSPPCAGICSHRPPPRFLHGPAAFWGPPRGHLRKPVPHPRLFTGPPGGPPGPPGATSFFFPAPHCFFATIAPATILVSTPGGNGKLFMHQEVPAPPPQGRFQPSPDTELPGKGGWGGNLTGGKEVVLQGAPRNGPPGGATAQKGFFL